MNVGGMLLKLTANTLEHPALHNGAIYKTGKLPLHFTQEHIFKKLNLFSIH